MLRLKTFGGLAIAVDASAPILEVRPQRMALLAILAAAGAKGVSRDSVLEILWPESEPERARHSLSQTFYGLRRDLGTEFLLATPALQLDPAKLASDIAEFRAAVSQKHWERAAELFTGPFLDGFLLSDAAEFERWAEEERAALSRDAMRALEAAARRATDVDHALDYWRRLTTLEALDSRIAAAYAEALASAGDPSGALLHVQAHAALVRRELELEPGPEVLRLLESLRESRPPAIRAPASSSVPALPATASPTVAATLLPNVARRPAVSAALRWGFATAVIVAVYGALFWRTRLVVPAASQPTQAGRSADTTSRPRSPLATRLYEDGLRAFYQFDAASASPLFVASLKEDPTFAMAAYYAWRASGTDSLAARAVSLAAHAPERDRLLILAHVAAGNSSLSAIPLAESLATRFPGDPEALRRAAEITNDLSRAVMLVNRAIALDSAAASGSATICRVCEEFHFLARRYELADSVDRVQQTLDRWTALRQGDYQPWQVRADYLIALGRQRDAVAALHRADSLGAPHVESPESALSLALRLDDFGAVNRICGEKLSSPAIDEFTRFRWLCTIGLRTQGRYHDALGLILEGRVPGSSVARTGMPRDRVNSAILDMEMGRSEAAAVQYARMAEEIARNSAPEGLIARNLAWQLTLSGTASALAGDTVRARAVADSVEVVGRRSLYARDPLLHHFLRGLVLAAATQHEQAVREFRAAVSSPSQGFTRINYEMGKSLLALNRPAEAISIVRSALRGGLDGPGLYVTRTELHELLARAFSISGAHDSATAHYAVVQRAWHDADPFLAERYYAAQQGLLRGGRSQR